jgi:toxin-antitoxin system PIN domain toxin
MTFLLDVNVLIALWWPDHEAHDRAQQWFARNSREGWATCPLTQSGFIRILSNPSFSQHWVTPLEASRVLASGLDHPTHHFWKDDLTFLDAVRFVGSQLRRHQQVTDAYLLGLAVNKKAKLATFDKRIRNLMPSRADRSYLEIIGDKTRQN